MQSMHEEYVEVDKLFNVGSGIEYTPAFLITLWIVLVFLVFGRSRNPHDQCLTYKLKQVHKTTNCITCKQCSSSTKQQCMLHYDRL